MTFTGSSKEQQSVSEEFQTNIPTTSGFVVLLGGPEYILGIYLVSALINQI